MAGRAWNIRYYLWRTDEVLRKWRLMVEHKYEPCFQAVKNYSLKRVRVKAHKRLLLSILYELIFKMGLNKRFIALTLPNRGKN